MIVKTIKTFLRSFYRRVGEEEECLTPPSIDNDLLDVVVEEKKRESKDDKIAMEKGVEKLAREKGIINFISLDELANLDIEDLRQRLDRHKTEGMTDEQICIARDIRRRMKNKKVFKNCKAKYKARKEKMNHLAGIHSTPPGQYPEKGPKPGKMGVIFYYLSIVLSILGIIMLCRYPLLHDQDRLQVVALGFSLIFFGLFSLVITNIIVNKENRAFVKYLDLKVEQYMATHKKNIQAIPPDGPVLDV